MKVIATSVASGKVIATRDADTLSDAIDLSRKMFRRYHTDRSVLPRDPMGDWDDWDVPPTIPVTISITSPR